ncbi:MAG: C2H2-type zinc finger protein [Thermoproteota archaeon]|nr:C2H2-type zinc finger protein [Thermoproteota archaeon]
MSHSLDRPDAGLPEVDICPICNARFSTPEDYQQHVQSQHPGTINADASSASTSEETGNYLGLSLIRASKENHKSIERIGKLIVQWFRKQGVRPEIYNLSTSEFPEGIESITKTLSIKDEKEEEVWALLQFYRDKDHANEVAAKMMQDESISELMKEFGGLISQGSNLTMGGFSRLRV